jgi:hypothetical protein
VKANDVGAGVLWRSKSVRGGCGAVLESSSARRPWNRSARPGLELVKLVRVAVFYVRTVFRRVFVEEREALSGRELGGCPRGGGRSATERDGAHEGSHGGLRVQCVRIWGSPREERSETEENRAGEGRMCLEPGFGDGIRQTAPACASNSMVIRICIVWSSADDEV